MGILSVPFRIYSFFDVVSTSAPGEKLALLYIAIKFESLSGRILHSVQVVFNHSWGNCRPSRTIMSEIFFFTPHSRQNFQKILFKKLYTSKLSKKCDVLNNNNNNNYEFECEFEWMRDDETNAMILAGTLDSNGAIACKEEPLHSWVPESNHELDGQQQPQVSLVPTAVYSYM